MLRGRTRRVFVFRSARRVALGKLQPHDLAAYYHQRLATGAKPGTVRLSHSIIHRALAMAQKWRLVHENVADAVDPPKARPPEIQPLNQDQARALLEAAEGDDLEALYVILLTTGCRINEALALRWDDLDLDARTMRIARSLSWAKGGGPRYGTPKGGKGRNITLTDRSAAALRRHRLRQNEQRLAMGEAWAFNGLVFTNTIGGPLRRDHVSRRSFKPLLAAAGLPASTRLHDLRHSCATLLLGRGVHPKLVQELLGHASIALTLDRYTHWVPSMGEQTAVAMEAALS
jgi:integrase